MKANLICEALKGARLFELDRNEENEPMNMFIENKGYQTFFINEPTTLK